MARVSISLKKLMTVIALLFVSCFDMLAAETVIVDSICDSKLYPGTNRTYSVCLSKQAPGEVGLMLCFDGDVFAARSVVDSLVACHSMPPVAMVFLNPGVVADGGRVARYNRSNEFDAIDGRMAEFVEVELLPKVVMRLAQMGITISVNPDMHAVMGASSGGIAAFTLAWQRPDLFRRVYCSVGTFVAMRGGDAYPALVRKTEPQPLKIFLHDGSNDAWNPLFGHWFEYNQLMLSALEFAGYQVAHVWDDGGHSIRGGIREFPAAMSWLWSDWQTPLKAGSSGNDMLQSLLIDGEGWTVATEDIKFPKPNTLKTSTGRKYKVSKNCALAISPNNKIVVETEPNSDWLVASIVDSKGALTCRQRFYWLHNVAHSADATVRQMAFDADGNLFVATNMGVQICDQNGRVRAILPLPKGGAAERLMFKGDCLYVESCGVVYMRRLRATGYDPLMPTFVPKSQGQG